MVDITERASALRVRARSGREHLLIGLLLLSTLVAAHSSVFLMGRSLMPIAPSYSTLPATPFGYEGPVSDGTSAIDPAASLNVSHSYDAFNAQWLVRGTIPLWNPYQGLGLPYLANGYSAALSLWNPALAVLPRHLFEFVYLFAWVLSAWFTCLFLRVVGVGLEGGVLGAIAVLSSGFFQYYFGVREVVAVAVWFPVLLYAVERTLHEPRWRWRHLLLTIAIYGSFTGGQPEVTFISLSAVSVYVAASAIVQHQCAVRFATALLPGALCGLLTSAPFIVSFVDYAFTAYSDHPAGAPVGRIHLAAPTLAVYVMPHLFGRVHFLPPGLSPADWNWNMCPGWVPVATAIGALFGLACAVQRRSRPLLVVALLGIVVVGKIWGIAPFVWLDRLPLSDRVIYPRYAAFLPAFSLAILAGAGWDWLRTQSLRVWIIGMAVWVAAAAALYGAAVVWRDVPPDPQLRVFRLLGLAWIVLVPGALTWLRVHRGSVAPLLVHVAVGSVMVSQFAAYQPGYSPVAYAVLSASVLVVWLQMVTLMGAGSAPPTRSALLVVAAGVLSAVPALAMATWAEKGLPLRYDVLTKPLYIRDLLRLQRDTAARAYAVDGTPQPNLATPLGIIQLNTLEALLPLEQGTFLQQHLDPRLDPLWFSGNTGGREHSGRASEGLLAGKRYFDLAGVRYILVLNDAPVTSLYDTRDVAGGAVAAPSPLNAPVESSVSWPGGSIRTVEVFLSTYARRNEGTVHLTLIAADGRKLAHATRDAAEIVDNAYAAFSFQPVVVPAGETLLLRLAFDPSADRQNSMIAAWVYGASIEPRFLFRVPLETSFRLLRQDKATGVQLWENPTALPRAFLACPSLRVESWREALAALPTIPDLARTVVLDETGSNISTCPDGTAAQGELLDYKVTPNTVRIRYRARTVGVLVSNDSFAPGWRATVSGEPSEVFRVDGVFRGVWIPRAGEHVVEFWYRPPRWWQSVSAAGVGLAITVGLSIIGAWRRRSTPPLLAGAQAVQ